MSETRYTVTFEATPGWTWPAIQRLRRLLKIAGRRLGLRCVAVRQDDGTTDGKEVKGEEIGDESE